MRKKLLLKICKYSHLLQWNPAGEIKLLKKYWSRLMNHQLKQPDWLSAGAAPYFQILQELLHVDLVHEDEVPETNVGVERHADGDARVEGHCGHRTMLSHWLTLTHWSWHWTGAGTAQLQVCSTGHVSSALCNLQNKGCWHRKCKICQNFFTNKIFICWFWISDHFFRISTLNIKTRLFKPWVMDQTLAMCSSVS